MLEAETDEVPAGASALLWQGTPRQPTVRSLTAYLEEHASEVRRRYLAWAYELGQTVIRGRRLCERFIVPGSGSFWALSLFVEQSTWKQRSLQTIVKLLALLLLLERERPATLNFRGADGDLSRVLEALCRERNIEYTYSRSSVTYRSGARTLRGRLPRPLIGLGAQFYFLVRWLRLRRAVSPGYSEHRDRRSLLICAPFFNHNADQRSGRQFTSRYWGALPQLLTQSGLEVSWLHTFYPHHQVPSAAAAARIIRLINAESPAVGRQSLVDAHPRLSDFPRIFVRWLGLMCESLRVGASLRARFRRRAQESFWPLIRRDWANAFRGGECVATLFCAQAFDRALQQMPHQEEGIYLMENQGWERALIRAWGKHGHGRLAGVAHSTVRFWDLRYHCDPRVYDSGGDFLPRPQVVVLNGEVARNEYLATSRLREQLIDCEALRYLHLRPCSPRPLRRDEPLRVLVLTDFMPEATRLMLKIVNEATAAARLPLEVWVKPHPNCPVDPAQFPASKMRVVDGPVALLCCEAHMVLASNTTSAAVDAYATGSRIAIFDDRTGVNFSPLRGISGVSFVHGATELHAVIEALRPGDSVPPRRTASFFHIEPDLRRWRSYFGLDAATGSGI